MTNDHTLNSLRGETRRRTELEAELVALQHASQFQLSSIETMKDQVELREAEVRDLKRRLEDLQRLVAVGEDERRALQSQVRFMSGLRLCALLPVPVPVSLGTFCVLPAFLLVRFSACSLFSYF